MVGVDASGKVVACWQSIANEHAENTCAYHQCTNEQYQDNNTDPFSHLFIFLPFYIAFKRFQRNTSNSGAKVAIRPQTWQTAFELRVLLTQVPAARSLDILHQSMDTKLWVT